MESPTRGEIPVRQKALALLARREHSIRELSRKLVARGIQAELVRTAVSRLRGEGLVSDARFTETFVGQRMAKGVGPIRIRRELRERGVDDATITRYLPRDEEIWLDSIARVRRKRFGAGRPADAGERARQMRFLAYRGFDSEQIRHHFASQDDD